MGTAVERRRKNLMKSFLFQERREKEAKRELSAMGKKGHERTLLETAGKGREDGPQDV